jgi:hypothetical protein
LCVKTPSKTRFTVQVGHDLLPYLPEKTREDDAPFHARVTLKTAREALTIGVIPDRVFSLAFKDRTRLNFALELDRGTMDIKSRQLVGKSSFRRKVLGYYQLWKESLHTTQWGFKAFRVLTVTPSEKRIENMIAVQKKIVGEQGSNLFLFTTPTRLAEKSPLADVWVTGKGAPAALLP